MGGDGRRVEGEWEVEGGWEGLEGRRKRGEREWNWEVRNEWNGRDERMGLKETEEDTRARWSGEMRTEV